LIGRGAKKEEKGGKPTLEGKKEPGQMPTVVGRGEKKTMGTCCPNGGKKKRKGLLVIASNKPMRKTGRI